MRPSRRPDAQRPDAVGERARREVLVEDRDLSGRQVRSCCQRRDRRLDDRLDVEAGRGRGPRDDAALELVADPQAHRDPGDEQDDEVRDDEAAREGRAREESAPATPDPAGTSPRARRLSRGWDRRGVGSSGHPPHGRRASAKEEKRRRSVLPSDQGPTDFPTHARSRRCAQRARSAASRRRGRRP